MRAQSSEINPAKKSDSQFYLSKPDKLSMKNVLYNLLILGLLFLAPANFALAFKPDSTIEEKYKYLQKEYISINKKFLELRLENENLKKQVSAGKEKEKELLYEVKSLNKDVTFLEKEVDSLSDKYENLIDKIESEKEALAQTQSEIDLDEGGLESKLPAILPKNIDPAQRTPASVNKEAGSKPASLPKETH